MGASYGAGNYGMNGRAYDPRFLFTWPSAKSAVMGPAQLAGVLEIVARAVGRGRRARTSTPRAFKGMQGDRRGAIEEQSLPFFLSGMLYDDGVIDPRDTRTDPRHLPVRDREQAVRRHRPVRGVPAMTLRRATLRPPRPRVRRRRRMTRLLVANRAEIASPGVPHLPQARHRDRRGPLRRGRRAAVRARGRRRRTPARQRAGRDLPATSTWSSTRPRRPAPTRSTPATGSSPRTPTSPARSSTPG